ncbi:MAG: ATP--guanido phosphotransferase [Clostridia bacterium]|nr:ATP--guanido phosphotransferase [Clostridia bacterium]
MDILNDVVLTTRIRFARNIKGRRFPNNMIDKQRKEVLEYISNGVKDKYNVLELNNMDEVTKNSLFETHVISKELLDGNYSALIIDEEKNITAMVNEEDHLRIQAFENGFNIDKAYENITSFDNYLSSKLDYAYSESYGYITACPTCIGTGMRVSVMLHLPALEKIGALNKIFNEITNLGISVRGMYGENTNGEGAIYQISNQKTLGITEQDIIEQVKQVTNYVVKQERKARDILKDKLEVKDDIFRSYGILKNAYIMSKKEAMRLLSNVRMGINMDEIKDIELNKVDKIIKNIGKNTLRKNMKEHFGREQENVKRAEYIRENV